MKNNTFSIIKTIGTLLVVMGHVVTFYTGRGAFDIGTTNKWLSLIFDYIYAFHMPMFFFISGAIYQICLNRGKYKYFGKFAINKAKRLLIPYAIFGCFYVTPVMLILHLTNDAKAYLLKLITNTDSRHLWYLWALFLIFMLTDVIRRLRIKNWLIALILITIVLEHYKFLLPEIFGVFYLARDWCYFLIGMLFVQYKDEVDAKLLYAYTNIYISIAAFSSLALLVYLSKGTTFVKAMLGIIGMYGFCFSIPDGILQLRIFRIIRDNSMGIYLFHPMIIYLLFYTLQSRYNSYLTTISIFSISLLLSIAFAKLAKVLKLNIIFGE